MAFPAMWAPGAAALALGLLAPFTATADAPEVEAVAMPEKAERRKCPYHSHVGCMLDIVVKSCAEDAREEEDDLGYYDMIDPHNQDESVWMCCCDDFPDKECERVPGFEACNASIAEHVGPVFAKGKAATLEEAIVAVQLARGALLERGGEQCGALFAAEPVATCGPDASPPVDRLISRADLYCEFLTFQWEAHGYGDPADFRANGCPMDPTVERRLCTHYQHMGCLLDVFSRACNDDEDEVHDLVDPRTEESVWLCCCQRPYESCTRAGGSATCNSALMSHVGPLVKKGKSVKRDEVIAAVQKTRAALREKGGAQCAFTAAPEPLDTCGASAEPPVQQPIARKDLYCELLTWQWEELGDGEAAEFERAGCGAVDATTKGRDGERRMGGVLLRPERHNYEL